MKMLKTLKKFIIIVKIKVLGMSESQYQNMVDEDIQLNGESIKSSILIKDIPIDETADLIF